MPRFLRVRQEDDVALPCQGRALLGGYRNGGRSVTPRRLHSLDDVLGRTRLGNSYQNVTGAKLGYRNRLHVRVGIGA